MPTLGDWIYILFLLVCAWLGWYLSDDDEGGKRARQLA